MDDTSHYPVRGRNRTVFGTIGALIALGALFIAWRASGAGEDGPGAGAQAAPPPPEVSVAPVVEKSTMITAVPAAGVPSVATRLSTTR